MMHDVPPAKSRNLDQAVRIGGVRNPSGPHTHAATARRRKIAHSPMNHSMAENFNALGEGAAFSAGVMRRRSAEAV